jgi:hypothetical protein
MARSRGAAPAAPTPAPEASENEATAPKPKASRFWQLANNPDVWTTFYP